MASTHITGGMGSTASFAGGSTVSSTSSSTPIQQLAMAPGAAPSGPAPEALTAASEETRQDLELKLKELIECLLELSITVYDFQPESNSLVHQKIQELISQISDIDAFKDKLDIMVPMEVLSFIEDGKNPDLFTKSFIECVAGENQFTNGKITAMKSFESSLTQNLGAVFPEEMDEYQDILKNFAAGPRSGSGAGAPEPEPETGVVNIKEESTPGEMSMASVNTASTLSSASTSLSPSS
ncbi:Mediator of RNA polymerase II transcription subunit 10 [Podila epicladia]|nr:Mediator of RNA polymerase II transcription subunit 10 [Podila epicladia]KAG0098701.1 Mediator of RNA polymerase II transcription subunit 10 [Podila epicladia]